MYMIIGSDPVSKPQETILAINFKFTNLHTFVTGQTISNVFNPAADLWLRPRKYHAAAGHQCFYAHHVPSYDDNSGVKINVLSL